MDIDFLMDFNYFRWISTLLIAQSTISIKNCVKFIQILLENGQIQSKIGQNLTYIVIQFYCQILSFEKMLKSDFELYTIGFEMANRLSLVCCLLVLAETFTRVC